MSVRKIAKQLVIIIIIDADDANIRLTPVVEL